MFSVFSSSTAAMGCFKTIIQNVCFPECLRARSVLWLLYSSARLHRGQQSRFGGRGQQLPVSWSNRTDFWTPSPGKPSDDGYFSFMSDKAGLVRRGHLLSVSPLFCSPSPPRRDLWIPPGNFGETGRVELAKTRRRRKRQRFSPARRENCWLNSALTAQQRKITREMLRMPDHWETSEFALCYAYLYVYIYRYISEEHLARHMPIGSYSTVQSGLFAYSWLYLLK